MIVLAKVRSLNWEGGVRGFVLITKYRIDIESENFPTSEYPELTLHKVLLWEPLHGQAKPLWTYYGKIRV